MKARYQYRIYSTTEQQTKLAKLFGCCRVVWNDALAHCIELYKSGEKKLSNSELQKRFITQAKKTVEREWLKEVSNIPLQQSLNDLEPADQNFFKSCKGKRKGKKLRPPKLKKRNAKQSARFRIGGFKLDGEKISLAKIGNLKIVWSRPLPNPPSSVTVIKDAANRYFLTPRLRSVLALSGAEGLSFVVEVNTSTPLGVDPERSRRVNQQPLPESPNNVGIDLGIKTFAVLSSGEKIDAPRPLKQRIKRLRKLNRNLSRKQRGSKRYERARVRKAKLSARMKDTRKDFLHKLSTRIINENQVIVLEDLNVSGMVNTSTPLGVDPERSRRVKNRKLSKEISDLGWRQFRTFLEGKAEKYGRDFRVISRWEPTTQKCSCCGFVGGKLDLSVREWTCLNCETVHDRDGNAATNILVAGGLSETLNGRGGRQKTSTREAAALEALTRLKEPVPLSIFDILQ